jgi:hypothetical protein
VRIELTKRFPIPLREGFDFLREVGHWPSWYAGITQILEAPPGGSWGEPGDTISFHYKVLGRLLDGKVVMKEMREYELVRSVASIAGLPQVHQEYRYTAADDGSFLLTVVLETEEVSTFLGRVVDRMMLPGIMERDLKRTMENLQDTFAVGVPSPVWWP